MPLDQAKKINCPGLLPEGKFWTSMKSEGIKWAHGNLSELGRQITEFREAEEARTRGAEFQKEGSHTGEELQESALSSWIFA